jgi:COMPASS component SWD3
MKSFEKFRELSGHEAGITSVAYSPCGRFLASADGNAKILIWNVDADYKLEREMTGHERGINGISWSSDSRLIASCSDDKTIKLWEITTV